MIAEVAEMTAQNVSDHFLVKPYWCPRPDLNRHAPFQVSGGF
jgi:hypothetical protein